MRLPPTQNSIVSGEKVGEGAGRLLEIWNLKWGRIRVPGGVQFNADVSRCRQGINVTLIDVGALSFRPPSERTARRQIGSSSEVAQEVSALAPAGPLQQCGRAPLQDVILHRHKGQALVALRPLCPRNCSRGGDCRRGVLT